MENGINQQSQIQIQMQSQLNYNLQCNKCEMNNAIPCVSVPELHARQIAKGLKLFFGASEKSAMGLIFFFC